MRLTMAWLMGWVAFGVIAAHMRLDDQQREIAALEKLAVAHNPAPEPASPEVMKWASTTGDILATPTPAYLAEPQCYDRQVLTDDLTDAEFIRVAYRTLLGREPDALHMGLDHGESRADMIAVIMDSPEFRKDRLPKMLRRK